MSDGNSTDEVLEDQRLLRRGWRLLEHMLEKEVYELKDGGFLFPITENEYNALFNYKWELKTRLCK